MRPWSPEADLEKLGSQLNAAVNRATECLDALRSALALTERFDTDYLDGVLDVGMLDDLVNQATALESAVDDVETAFRDAEEVA